MTISEAGTADIPASSRTVLLRRLTIRQEGEEWIFGRIESGVFVALPPIGAQVIELLRAGHTAARIRSRLLEETGEDFNVDEFVDALVELGFVEALDGEPIVDESWVRSTLAHVRAQHVRWLVHPATIGAVALVVIAAIAGLAVRPATVPQPAALYWSHTGSLVILVQALVAWSSIFLHEFAHLLTARAAGVPGRISMGTRLQFLVAQTDVSGIWAVPRRDRIKVYLSGMTTNAVIAALGVFVLLASPPHPVTIVARVVVLNQFMLIAGEFAFFMRTDIYYIVQDLARCRDLYGDASAYAKYRGRKLLRRTAEVDPSAALPERERRFVRAYAWFFVPGSMITVAVFFVVTLPLLAGLLGGAFAHVFAARSVPSVLDGAVVIAVLGTSWTVWFTAWWKRHGARVQAYVRKRRGVAARG